MAKPTPSKAGRVTRKTGRRVRVPRVLTALNSPLGRAFLAVMLILGVVGGVVFNHLYWKYSAIIDDRLAGGAFDRTARLLATPRMVALKDPATIDGISKSLRAAGYTQDRDNPIGWFAMTEDSIRVYPGDASHFQPEPAQIEVEDGYVSRIVALDTGGPLSAYQLEPELITNLFDAERSKRRLFKFSDYPQHLVDAVIAIEDHRFYSHWGIDFIRTTGAAIEGLRQWKKPRGTSTLTQQLARNFFLTREATVTRKAAEAMIAIQLEGRLTKEQIFENYSNQIFMGRLGSFNIHGFGEAATAFFDKDVRDITLAEAALLAGLPQGPSYLNPHRYPDRAKFRRNQVLTAMLRTDMIDQETHDAAAEEGIVLARGHLESRDAPYFVDLVNKDLQKQFVRQDLITQDYWVFTTLDKQLQQFAVDAVREGMQLVDERLSRQRRFRNVEQPPRAQAALVAMDPHTGEVKAVVGGRDYGGSQLNRALASRQPGSVFKPFVFAAALDSALDSTRMRLIEQGHGSLLPEYARKQYPAPPGKLTTSTIVLDEPTEFIFSEEQPPYKPSNHLDKFFGRISLRYALLKSVNVATVKVGEMAGYERVADLARRAGMGDVQPFPSLMLGAFEVTPLDVAAAYTSFVNKGVRIEPRFVRYVRATEGRTLFESQMDTREAMDARVAFIITDMMEDVIRHGSGVRARFTYGITDAAGKTGTDDDGWFAGFTNNLVCVVWVGFDDNTDLALEGAHSALPIWAMFMKKAHELSGFSNPGPFEAPEGVVRVPVDPVQRMLTENYCTGCKDEVYIAGSQPDSADMASHMDRRRRAAARAKKLEQVPPGRGILPRLLGVFDKNDAVARAGDQPE